MSNHLNTSPRSNVPDQTRLYLSSQRRMVIGVGSHHGDDRAGWEVIDRLSASKYVGDQQLDLHKAAVPHDALDWLERDCALHLIDACAMTPRSAQQGASPGVYQFVGELASPASSDIHTEVTTAPVDFQCWSWTPELSTVFASLRSRSTHQFDLLATLQLAAALGKLPNTIQLWLISIDSTAKNAEISDATQARIAECLQRLELELQTS